MRLYVFAIAALCASPALGMVSGFYDSANKIAAIFASGVVADALGQAPVGSVSEIGTSKDGAAQWMIRTQDCDLIVDVTAKLLPEGMVGTPDYLVEIAKGCD
ncbi:MAG: hypothetical protein CFE34_02970 [Rhodobacteraceae bacterium PARR1]|nr:MAG: hypothetical protein CFE34_02970 [Rhodobacteraceae bacterium PARR1]